MLDGLSALLALEKLGTVGEAAVQLRLTQSAVSKRLQSLENEVGTPLTSRQGRRLILTPAGLDLLTRARPLLVELENLRKPRTIAGIHEFSIGVADSIAGSWGPAVLRRCLTTLPLLRLAIHAHRGTLILENLKLGRYHLGLVAGQAPGDGLVAATLPSEEMILVGARSHRDAPVLTIEPVSATWKEIGPAALAHTHLRGRPFEFVESFFAAAQMARQGFGQALVPEGTAKALGFRKAQIQKLSPKITRGIHLVARKSVYQLEPVQEFIRALAMKSPL